MRRRGSRHGSRRQSTRNTIDAPIYHDALICVMRPHQPISVPRFSARRIRIHRSVLALALCCELCPCRGPAGAASAPRMCPSLGASSTIAALISLYCLVLGLCACVLLCFCAVALPCICALPRASYCVCARARVCECCVCVLCALCLRSPPAWLLQNLLLPQCRSAIVAPSFGSIFPLVNVVTMLTWPLAMS